MTDGATSDIAAPVDVDGHDAPAPERLRAHIEAVENMEEEKAAVADDIKQRFAMAAGEGFDVPAMKAVIKRRKKHRAELAEEDELIQLYENTLAKAGGAVTTTVTAAPSRETF